MIEQLRATRNADGYSRWEGRTDKPLLWLALVFLGLLLLPLFVRLPPWQDALLSLLNGVIWAIFAVDYVARLYLSPKRWRFVRSHPLDLLIIVLPMLRPLRAFRAVRLVALLGYAHRHAHRSLHARVSVYVGVATAVVIAVSAVAMYDAERRSSEANITSLEDALWWAVTTVTTVGYGDRYPITGGGRVIALGLMVVGIALLGVVTATVAAWFVSRLQDVQEAEQRTEATLSQVLSELRGLHARLDALAGLRQNE